MWINKAAVFLVTFLGLSASLAWAGGSGREMGQRQEPREWTAAVKGPARPLPFDPMVLPTPRPPAINKLGEDRWWAALLSQAVVAIRLVDPENAERMADVTEVFLQQQEVSWDFGVVRQPKTHLRLSVGERSGGPKAAFVLSW